MQTASTSSKHISAELPSMLATLCSYEGWLGPYHPQTLRLMVLVGIRYQQAGDLSPARALLDRAVRDLRRHLDGNYDTRLQATAALRDLLIEQREYERAAAVQEELLECQIQCLGADHPETLASRAQFPTTLLETLEHVSSQ